MMKTITKIGLSGLAISGLLFTTVGRAEDEGGQTGKKGCRQEVKQQKQECKQEFKDEIKAHLETQRKENQEFHQTLEGKSINEKLSAMISHRKTQFEENGAFMKQIHEKLLASVKTSMQEKNVPEDKINEVLDKKEKKQAEREAEQKKRQDEIISKLTALANNSNLSDEEKEKQLKELMKEKKGKGQECKGGKGQDKAPDDKNTLKMKVKE